MQKIAITHGECGSVNYELLIRTFLDGTLFDVVHPVLFGSSKILSMTAKSMGHSDFFQKTKRLQIEEIVPVTENISYSRGTATKTSGEMAVASIEKAIQSFKDGIILTLPVETEAIHLSHPEFKNQATTIASFFSACMPYRMFLSERLKTTFLVSTNSPTGISPDRIKSRILALHKTFKEDFSVLSPRIAVLSMNEDGSGGDGDKQILTPVINELMVNGNAVFGPFTTAQALEMRDNFDVFLCMYQQQQETLFKDIETSSLCYFTAGLPVVHIEPQTALNMGQLTDPLQAEQDFRNAIYNGIDILSHRTENHQLLANPLGFSKKVEVTD
ncbi:MAG: 4-hydroxythreonine-4-phosphate dehydrogenase PdxA [Bacteroidales bacterium]|jgi:4-hydroxythreonine-4-phosphate dehydrogenase|nr:4-hydroxythreonine-4-phosphate dehydrogenase PdxA [Bacteroidales bacterium]